LTWRRKIEEGRRYFNSGLVEVVRSAGVIQEGEKTLVIICWKTLGLE